MKIKNVCQGCADRIPGCHSTCEKYLTARAELDTQKAGAAELKKHDRDFDSVFYRRYDPAKKK